MQQNGGLIPESCRSCLTATKIVGTVTARASEETGLLEGGSRGRGWLGRCLRYFRGRRIRDGETQEQGGQAGGMSICMESFHSDPRLILSHHWCRAPGFCKAALWVAAA